MRTYKKYLIITLRLHQLPRSTMSAKHTKTAKKQTYDTKTHPI